MDLNSVRILIVDDSLPMRIALQQFINLHGSGTNTVKAVSSAAEAEKIIKSFLPDCIVAGASLPEMASGDFIKKLHNVLPVPVIAVGSKKDELAAAIKSGAADSVQSGTEKSFSVFCSELCSSIRKAVHTYSNKQMPYIKQIGSKTKYNIIAIGASTGGTEATVDVLTKLPSDVPGIVIVQHMPAGFTRMYADRLDRITMLNVHEAKNGDRVLRGTALIAEGGKHMRLAKDSSGYFVKCSAEEKVNGHCPSVSVLFKSVAQTAGSDAIGVILTGMGNDGADGLLEMRKAGAFTIGQDKKSSVVYGMPMVAQKIGAVIQQAPVNAISGIILSKLK